MLHTGCITGELPDKIMQETSQTEGKFFLIFNFMFFYVFYFIIFFLSTLISLFFLYIYKHFICYKHQIAMPSQGGGMNEEENMLWQNDQILEVNPTFDEMVDGSHGERRPEISWPSEVRQAKSQTASTHRRRACFLFNFTSNCKGNPIPPFLLDMVQPLAKQLQLRNPHNVRFFPHNDPTLEIMVEQQLASFMVGWSERFRPQLTDYANTSKVKEKMKIFVRTHHLEHLKVLQKNKTAMLGEHLRIIRGYLVEVRKQTEAQVRAIRYRITKKQTKLLNSILNSK
jgi:hypothetical protein